MNPRIKDLYLVSYVGGTSGTFIASLIWVWLTDDYKPGITEHGETDYSNFVSNYSIKNFDHFDGYKTCKPLDENVPFVVRAHGSVDIDWINKHYPNNLIVNIVHDDRNRDRISANNAYKILYRTYNKQQSGMGVSWSKLLEISGIEERSPEEFTMDEHKKIINSMRYKFQGMLAQIELLGASTDSTNVLNLSFWDILHDKEKVLNLLGKHLNRPRTKKVIKVYDEYLYAQDAFLQQYAPWILEDEHRLLSNKNIK